MSDNHGAAAGAENQNGTGAGTPPPEVPEGGMTATQLAALQADFEKVKSNNAELLDELRKARSKVKDLPEDLDKQLEMAAAYDDMKQKEEEGKRSLEEQATIARDQLLEARREAKEALASKDVKIRKLIVDRALHIELRKYIENEYLLQGAMKLVEPLLEIVDDEPVVGAQNLPDFIKDWATKTPEGMSFADALDNGGGGVGGKRNPNIIIDERERFFDPDPTRGSYNKTKQGEVLRDSPSMYYEWVKKYETAVSAMPPARGFNNR